MEENPKKCKLCKKEIIGYGNNGEPLVKGQVCDDCNKKVILARLVGTRNEKN